MHYAKRAFVGHNLIELYGKFNPSLRKLSTDITGTPDDSIICWQSFDFLDNKASINDAKTAVKGLQNEMKCRSDILFPDVIKIKKYQLPADIWNDVTITVIENTGGYCGKSMTCEKCHSRNNYTGLVLEIEKTPKLSNLFNKIFSN